MKEQGSLAARAWNATKAKEDPEFAASAIAHQAELEARAADVVKTGLTVNPFEEKVKELNEKAKSDEDETALGTTGINREKAEKKEAKAEKAEDAAAADSLESKTRAELDEMAEAKGLNPGDFRNKAEIVSALEK